MGLDMYLNRHIYVGANYEHNNVTGVIEITKGGKPVKVDLSKVTHIVERVGYWRKANAVHKWFVDNVQRGTDDCREYYVDKSQLESLLKICKEISADHSLATKLPPQSGFFFGSTDMDEWYFNDIETTIQIIENVLTDGTVGDIQYQSSW